MKMKSTQGIVLIEGRDDELIAELRKVTEEKGKVSDRLRELALKGLHYEQAITEAM